MRWSGRHEPDKGPGPLATLWLLAEAAAVLFLLIAVARCGSATDGGDPAAAAASDPAGESRTAPPNTLTEAEIEEGWRLLFDGSGFAGWRGLGRDGIPAGHWVIEDGAIRKVASGDVPTAPDGQPLEGGDIMTIETFGDFELVLEWKVAPGANSGIKYNVSEEMSIAAPPRHAALGFEYQILDDDLHPDALNGPNRTAGALYDLLAPSEEKRLRPVGEYNEARIMFAERFGRHDLNGRPVLDFLLGSEPFLERLAASKYAPRPGIRRAPPGSHRLAGSRRRRVVSQHQDPRAGASARNPLSEER